MKRGSFHTAVGAVPLGVAGIGTAHAEPDRDRYSPDGPVLGRPKPINLNAFHTNDELATALQRIDRQSGRISLAAIGESAGRGEPIWEVQVGDGDTSIHLITQIHGDEAVGTEVALAVIRSLGLGNSKRIEHVLDELSFVIIPRVNPDGAMYHHDFDDSDVEWVGRRFNT